MYLFFSIKQSIIINGKIEYKGDFIMKKMNSKELRNLYLDFWKRKKHVVIESAPLIPLEDKTVLFTIAGMQQLSQYFQGTKHPKGDMLTDIQRCVRTKDIEEVGDPSHLTCFEMLGAWSLGAYWKEESIKMTYEFITSEKYLGIPADRLYVSVFAGDKDIPRDIEAFNAWKNAGLNENHIVFLSREHNFWAGDGGGPCGTDTEMFYDTGIAPCGPDCKPGCDCQKYLEFGNNVLIQFCQHKDGTYTKLSQKNIDQGLGLERILMILNNKQSAYDTDLYDGLKSKIYQLSNLPYEENESSYRIIMDHIRTVTFILGNNLEIVPSNKERGYVLRRLIRRTIRHMRKLGIKGENAQDLINTVIEEYGDVFPELINNKLSIFERFKKENLTFNRSLDQGLKEFNKIISRIEDKKISGENAFRLFDTFGFPIELTIELAHENCFEVDVEGFNKKLKEHQEKSRNEALKAKGGLESDGDIETKYHTTTHLLNAALKKVVGDKVHQMGSNINSERMRFDFSCDHKLTEEEKAQVENLVNEWIKADLNVKCEIMSKEDAIKSGAESMFIDKYPDRVKVYTIGDVSKEICGGPHVKNTGELDLICIQKEEASSAGVRRIKAKFKESKKKQYLNDDNELTM